MASEKVRLSRHSLSSLFRIYSFIFPYRWKFLIGMIALVISTAVVSVLPMGFRQLVDAANSNAMSAERLKELGLLLGGVLIIQASLSFVRIYYFEWVSQHGMADIRRTLYNKIISLPIPFFEGSRVGELNSRISSDVSQLQEALSVHLAMLVRQLVLPVVCIPFLFHISVKLTLIMMATIPVMIFFAVIFGRYIRTISRKAQDALARSMTVVEETFQGIEAVKSYTNEHFESRRYAQSNQEVVSIALYASKYRAGFVSFIIFAMFGAIVLIVSAGLSTVASGELSMGQLIEFLLFTIFIGSSLAGLSESYTVIQKTAGASERILELMNRLSEVELQDHTKNISINGKVEFRNVHFAYPSRPEQEVLQGVSFVAQPGMRIALVGPSGSGKSTIVRLLSRWYEHQSGQILLDEKAIDSYNITALRKNFGNVPQEVMLFGGTIRENIAYGKPEAKEEEIIEAARKANAWQFIKTFQEGLDTQVGERGLKLSGGQKQRIAIARAILRDPRILLLDEATSALDSESELLVKQALADLMKNRTTFIIAHRLSTIREADLILVINKGKIEEQGTHAELAVKENGLYQKLLRLQFEQDPLGM